MSAACVAVACSSCIQLHCAKMSNRIFATGINNLEKLQGIYFSAFISASSCLATQERSLRNKHRVWLVAKTRISAVNRQGFGRRGGKKSRFEKLQKGQMLPLNTQLFQNKPMPHGTLKNIKKHCSCRIYNVISKVPKQQQQEPVVQRRGWHQGPTQRKERILLFVSLCAYQSGDHIKQKKARKGHSKYITFHRCVASVRYCSSRKHSLKNQCFSS